MGAMHNIKHVTPLADYRLRLSFEDGTEGEVDLSHLVGKGVFTIWQDPNVFNDVSIGPSGELRWSDSIDLCPDALYMNCTGKAPEQIFPSLKASANARD